MVEYQPCRSSEDPFSLAFWCMKQHWRSSVVSAVRSVVSIRSVIILSDKKCQQQKCHSRACFFPASVFLSSTLLDPSTFTVVSHFHVRAERCSPPLTSVISLLWLTSVFSPPRLPLPFPHLALIPFSFIVASDSAQNKNPFFSLITEQIFVQWFILMDLCNSSRAWISDTGDEMRSKKMTK